MIYNSMDGFTIYLDDDKDAIDPFYMKKVPDYLKIKRYFLRGYPVCKGIAITYNGQGYCEGDCFSVKDAKASNAPQAARKAPVSAPTLDMFDNTDPNAPGTTDQNSAFWGLMDRLGKLTGKTGEEMKPVVVARALGENKGTSKLTVAEMDKVIRFVKDTIDLFEAHDRACRAEGVKA